ncbi:hypothetical protein [Parasitella parasitica]|uniref:Uncharacterized protein n=1 Tax=Parasitella parasitica TaxID=35722 RepID=A0A0B7N8S5_9FUNG|nr:hypothetical protein [Parasitella parasitica]
MGLVSRCDNPVFLNITAPLRRRAFAPKPGLFPVYDISGIISLLESLEDNFSLSISDLTRKLCWLLAITGNKRRRAPYVKSVIIRPHPNASLCPVLTYRAYLSRAASVVSIRSHPYRPQFLVNHVVRDVRSAALSVGGERVSHHVKSLMQYLSINGSPWAEQPLPKARALGPTLAIRNGASTDEAVLQGAWSSRQVLDAFYLLSRRTVTDLTRLTLNNG